MKRTRKIATFLLVVMLSLLVPACALKYSAPGEANREIMTWRKTEESPRKQTAAPVSSEAETEKPAESAAGRDRLPALGYVAAQLSLIPVAFWCAAKNRNGRRYST